MLMMKSFLFVLFYGMNTWMIFIGGCCVTGRFNRALFVVILSFLLSFGLAWPGSPFHFKHTESESEYHWKLYILKIIIILSEF